MKPIFSTCCAFAFLGLPLLALAQGQPSPASSFPGFDNRLQSAATPSPQSGDTEEIQRYREKLRAANGTGVSQEGKFLGRFAEALAAQGNKQKDVGLLTEAIGMYEKWVAVSPQEPVAQFNLGAALESLDALAPSPANKARMLQAYQAALALAPGDFQVQLKVGEVCLDLQRYPEAERCFREACRLYPEPNHYFRNLLGMSLLRQSRWAEAEVEFRQALALSPESMVYQLNIGAALLKQGKREAATPYVQEARRLGLKDHWSIKELGLENTPGPTVAMGAALANTAITASAAAPAANPPDALTLLQQQADAAYVADNYAQADALYTQLLDRSNASDTLDAQARGQPYSRRGYARMELKQMALARADFTQAETLYLLHDGTPHQIAYALASRALTELALDEPLHALADAAAACRLDSQYGHAQEVLARAWYALGAYDQAVHFLQKAKELDPKIPFTYSRKQAAINGQGRPKIDPAADTSADLAAGKAAYWKDHAAAIAAFTRVLEKRPGNAEALKHRASMYSLSKDYQRAYDDYASLVTLAFAYPNDEEEDPVKAQVFALTNRAQTAVSLRQWQAANLDCALMRKLLPDDRETLGAIADIELAISDAKSPPTEAQLAARAKAGILLEASEAVEAAEANGVAYNRSGMSSDAPYPTAVRLVDRLLQAEPANAQLLLLRGRVEDISEGFEPAERIKRHGRALDFYTKAIAAEPTLAEAYARRGFARADYRYGGYTKKELRADFEKAIVLGSDDSSVRDALAKYAEPGR